MMRHPLAATIRFLKAEDGPTAVEYAVMLALIILAVIGTVLASFLTFLIYVIRKSEALEAAAQKNSPKA